MWIAGQNVLGAKLTFKALLVHNGFVYLYGGTDETITPVDDIYQLDLSDDTVTNTGDTFPVAGAETIVPLVFNDI